MERTSLLKKIYSSAVLLCKDTHQTWISLDAMKYISEYIEQHPEKKPTRRLMRKLEREFYRSKRSGKK